MVAPRGGSSNHTPVLRRLADALPTLLRRRLRSSPVRKLQEQRRLTPRQVEKLIAEYHAGDSTLKLANSWRLHRTTVAEHLRRAGAPVRQRGIPVERLDEAVRLYSDGWSCRRIAEYYSCHDETARQTLRRAGIKLRKPWER